MSETVALEVALKSPVEWVWRALTDPATLSRWMLFETNDFKPVAGHAFQFRGVPGWGVVVDCEVIEVDEPRRLAYTWATGGQDGVRHATVVAWTLMETEAGGTRLRLEQSGFRSEARQEIGGARHGWTSMLEALRSLLDEA